MAEDKRYLAEVLESIEDHVEKKIIAELIKDWGEISFDEESTTV